MTTDSPLRVLVVDDTVFYRKIVSDVLAELPDVEVVSTAQNGEVAMSKIVSLKPDLLTLDIDMPKMDGLEVLDRMRSEAPMGNQKLEAGSSNSHNSHDRTGYGGRQGNMS